MTPNEWRHELGITMDPKVMGGKPCIRGTRIMVSVIVDNIAAGISRKEIGARYPSVPNGV